MKLIYILINSLFVFVCACHTQAQHSHITVEIPNIQQESTSIWRTINDIAFFEKMGYSVNLPKDALIDSLILKSKKGTFGSDDFAGIYELLETKVYNKVNYQQAVEKVNAQKTFIEDALKQLRETTKVWDWSFRHFETYPVIFTLYGSGGSYDPDTGAITLFTTTEGKFKNYNNPANTIIHEIVHMGIETSLIQKYKVSHTLKEYIVDKFVKLMFGQILPEYKVQQFGDNSNQDFLSKKEELKNLDTLLRQMSGQDE